MLGKAIQRARQLRQEANYPERKAWEALRTLRHRGITVRRQVPIEGLTVDFAIRAKRLVVEIDGSIHHRKDVQIADALRDKRLVAAGWRVIRIPADIAISADHLLEIVMKEVGLE